MRHFHVHSNPKFFPEKDFVSTSNNIAYGVFMARVTDAREVWGDLLNVMINLPYRSLNDKAAMHGDDVMIMLTQCHHEGCHLTYTVYRKNQFVERDVDGNPVSKHTKTRPESNTLHYHIQSTSLDWDINDEWCLNKVSAEQKYCSMLGKAQTKFTRETLVANIERSDDPGYEYRKVSFVSGGSIGYRACHDRECLKRLVRTLKGQVKIMVNGINEQIKAEIDDQVLYGDGPRPKENLHWHVEWTNINWPANGNIYLVRSAAFGIYQNKIKELKEKFGKVRLEPGVEDDPNTSFETPNLYIRVSNGVNLDMYSCVDPNCEKWEENMKHVNRMLSQNKPEPVVPSMESLERAQKALDKISTSFTRLGEAMATIPSQTIVPSMESLEKAQKALDKLGTSFTRLGEAMATAFPKTGTVFATNPPTFKLDLDDGLDDDKKKVLSDKEIETIVDCELAFMQKGQKLRWHEIDHIYTNKYVKVLEQVLEIEKKPLFLSGSDKNFDNHVNAVLEAHKLRRQLSELYD